MKIQEQDNYHGSALTQIVEHPSFKALNKGSERYGHYLVNANCHVFVRYRKTLRSPWTFTITPEQLEPMRNVLEADADLFLCLVCGRNTICILDEDQLKDLMDLDSTVQQWIRVEVPKGGSCHVFGAAGNLRHAVPHNAFPARLFD